MQKIEMRNSTPRKAEGRNSQGETQSFVLRQPGEPRARGWAEIGGFAPRQPEQNGGQRDIAFDCRFFLGDRPCKWHKSTGVLCKCEHYQRITERILMIKLDAMGDVLRTTALLPALAEAYPEAAITWITRRESRPLLERNPYLSEVIEYGPDALAQLQARAFDRAINLDAGKISASLASSANARQKDGFVLRARGFVQPTNLPARKWLEMGVFDDLKRQGRRTYQDLMLEIIGLPGAPHRYVLELTAEERSRGRMHLERLGVDLSRPVIGLNTGAGGRWELKRWREDGYLELVERLARKHDVQFVLLGGPEEHERHRRLASRSRAPLIDTGCDNTVRHFAAIVAGCSLVICGDTLAMHLSLALGRRTIVLFGPTSAAEIEMYGLGEKIMPSMDCLACYKSRCDFAPNCMDLISTDMVEAAVERQLSLIRNSKWEIRNSKKMTVAEALLPVGAS
ncbi:MAG TPA: glycosyltransferase family 9 protein [Terriglobia bacterium]|nr:glycosyltransferase family 9 protein [Terriglobia bacterium]